MSNRITTSKSVSNLKKQLKIAESKQKPTSKYGNPLTYIADVLAGSDDSNYSKIKNYVTNHSKKYGTVQRGSKNPDWIKLNNIQMWTLILDMADQGYPRAIHLLNHQCAFLMGKFRDYVHDKEMWR